MAIVSVRSAGTNIQTQLLLKPKHTSTGNWLFLKSKMSLAGSNEGEQNVRCQEFVWVRSNACELSPLLAFDLFRYQTDFRLANLGSVRLHLG